MFDCNEYGHVAADCPDKIPPSGTLAATTRSITLIQGIVLGLLLDIVTGTDTGSADLDPSHTLADIEATATTTHTEVTPDLITDTLTEAHHIIDTQVLIVISVTSPHRRSSSHRSSSTHSRDHSRSRPCTSYRSSRMPSSKPSSSSNKTTSKHQDRKYKSSPLMTPSLTTTVQMMHPVIPMMI